MRNILILSILIGIQNIGFSQSYQISRLIELGDSALKSNIGIRYHGYYNLDNVSYYKYTGWLKKGKEYPIKGDKTKGRFYEASLRYKILYPGMNELSSTLYIVIDKNLKVISYTSDIPNFILENRTCDFMSKDKVVTIGQRFLQEKGIKVEYYLSKQYQDDYFIWEIRNIIIEPTEGRSVDGLMETIKINPITGEKLEQKVTNYGYVF